MPSVPAASATTVKAAKMLDTLSTVGEGSHIETNDQGTFRLVPCADSEASR